MVGIVFFPTVYCGKLGGGGSDCPNGTGYQISLYIHASAYLVSLGFDRYVDIYILFSCDK